MTRGPILAFSAQLPFCAAALLNVLIEPEPDLFMLGFTASSDTYQREFHGS